MEMSLRLSMERSATHLIQKIIYVMCDLNTKLQEGWIQHHQFCGDVYTKKNRPPQ